MHTQVQTTNAVTRDFFKDMAQRESDVFLMYQSNMQSAQLAVNDLKSLVSDIRNGEIKSVIDAVASLQEEVVSQSIACYY